MGPHRSVAFFLVTPRYVTGGGIGIASMDSATESV